MVLALAYLYLFLSLNSNKALYVKLSTYLISQHQSQYLHSYSSAIKALDKGNTEPAMRALRDWQNIRKGDRAFTQKRGLLLRLTGVLHDQNRVSELLDWTKIWQALDSRDITARAFFFEALRLNPETHAEGIDGLALTYLHFPKNQRIAKFYANTVSEGENFSAADKIQNDKLSQQILNWEIFWDTGEGFNTTQKHKVDLETGLEDDGNRINLVLPENTRKFRLDLPPSSALMLSHLAIQINEQPYIIDQNTFKLIMMQYTKGTFISNGDTDPYIIFDLVNTALAQGEALNLEISFRISSTNQHHRAKQ